MTNKLDFKLRVIIILLIILVILAGYFISDTIDEYESAQYGMGLQDGGLAVIQQIQTTQSVPVIIQQGNQTSLQWVSLQDICTGGGGQR